MPGVTRENVGSLTPADLMWAVDFFQKKYEGGAD
jgi:hypothetical protein